MFNILTSKPLQIFLVVVCIIGMSLGVKACTLTCPTVTGKREEPGFFGNYYLDLSDNTTETVSSKIYHGNDPGDHYC